MNARLNDFVKKCKGVEIKIRSGIDSDFDDFGAVGKLWSEWTLDWSDFDDFGAVGKLTITALQRHQNHQNSSNLSAKPGSILIHVRS